MKIRYVFVEDIAFARKHTQPWKQNKKLTWKKKEMLMNKKHLGLGLLVLFVLSALLISCDEPKEVKFVPDKASQVKAVTAAQSADNSGVVVSWEAAKDGVRYDVYRNTKERNITTRSSWCTWVTNESILPLTSTYRGYDEDLDGPASSYNVPSWQNINEWLFMTNSAPLTKNPDIDKWNAGIRIGNEWKGHVVRFGVVTYDANGFRSDIKWSSYLQLK